MTVTAHEQRALVDWTGSCLPSKGAILRRLGGSSLSEALSGQLRVRLYAIFFSVLW
jgi:hypothetical protein